MGKLAGYYMKVAKRLMKDFFITLPDADLAYLPEGHPLLDGYIQAVHWPSVLKCIRLIASSMMLSYGAWYSTVYFRYRGHCCHQITLREEHGGENMGNACWCCRAGAGDYGIIPDQWERAALS